MQNYDLNFSEFEDEFVTQGEYEQEYAGEYDFENELEAMFGSEMENYENLENYESPFSQEEEMELASELLAVNNEQELEEFMGRLVSRFGKFARSPIGRKIGGFLKGVARKALPVVGTAAGGFFGGPLGAKIGGKLGGFASRLFEMELEGLSNEDKEFEIARRIVRFVGDTARNIGRIPVNQLVGPRVKKAIIDSARRNAPGLLRNGYRRGTGGTGQKRGHSGRWVRRGNALILYGA
ncbi:MAG: hypothetical protein NW226_26775 [Microscillaceae bacterium]|nr:hypothetical protein [Microscillaceae bacterium]